MFNIYIYMYIHGILLTSVRCAVCTCNINNVLENIVRAHCERIEIMQLASDSGGTRSCGGSGVVVLLDAFSGLEKASTKHIKPT